MTPSIELFLISSCLITIAISGWLANLLVDNSLARVISLRVSVKFKKNYKELESLCIDSRNSFLIYGGYAALVCVAIFTYRDFGIFYALLIPVIAYFSILISQELVHQGTFAKERIDSLLENLLVKEKEFKSSSHSQLEIVQLLCNYLISEYEYETHEHDISHSAEEQPVSDAVGIEKTKHHLKNVGFELGSGLKILLLVIAIGVLGAGLKQLAKEDKSPAKSLKLEQILKEHTLPENK